MLAVLNLLVLELVIDYFTSDIVFHSSIATFVYVVEHRHSYVIE